MNELDNELRQAVKDAEAVMTLDELATFANLPENDVKTWTESTPKRKSKRKSKRRQGGAGGGGRRTTSARQRPVPGVERTAEPSVTAADAPADVSTSKPAPAATAQRWR